MHGSDIACPHTAGAIPSCHDFESWAPEGVLQTLAIRTAATEVDARGLVRPWDAPGLWVEIDRGWVDADTTAVLE